MPRQQMSSQQMPSMQPPQFEAQQLTQLEHAEMDEASNNEEFFSAHPEQPEQQHANYSGSQQEFQIRTESQMPGSVRKHMLTRQSSKEKKKMATFQGFSLGMGLGMANTIRGK